MGRVKVFAGKPVHEEGDEFAEKAVELEELVNGYDSVLIATGTWSSKLPNVPGVNAEGVTSALQYVYRFRLKELGLAPEPPSPGRKVIVIGGGYSAVDAAEQAHLSGAEVVLAYRRTLREAPAGFFEMERLKGLGIEILELVSPIEVVVEGNRARGLKLQRMKLGPPDESGRPRPVPVPGSEFVLEGDTIVFATGEAPTPPLPGDEAIQGKVGVRLSRNGTIAVNKLMQTGNPKVFAAGDVVQGPSKLGPAVRSGLYAARYMDAWLQARLIKAPLTAR